MNTLCSLTFTSLIVWGLPSLVGGDAPPMEKDNPSKIQEAHTFQMPVQLDYLLFLPKGHQETSVEKWPLILFLHGAGERGDDLELVKKHGIPKIVEKNPDFPFIAVSPQCPEGSWWTSELRVLNALLDEIIEKYSVDTKRIYLTGLSMGGFGTWSLATMQPERFAAIAPICGGGEPRWAARSLKDVPVWVFHGAKDTVVPPKRSEEMVEALKAQGGDVQFTLYPDAGHDSWTETYDNPELYEWFRDFVRLETGIENGGHSNLEKVSNLLKVTPPSTNLAES